MAAASALLSFRASLLLGGPVLDHALLFFTRPVSPFGSAIALTIAAYATLSWKPPRGGGVAPAHPGRLTSGCWPQCYLSVQPVIISSLQCVYLFQCVPSKADNFVWHDLFYFPLFLLFALLL
jgi:hypothetical protein